MGRTFFPALIACFAMAARGAPVEKYGHRAFAEAPAAVLSEVGPYRDTGRIVQLRPSAAQAFLKMAAAAREEGVGILPISGFRPISYQKNLFARAVKRYGSEEKAARWVAPPGYSEHATGWTLDVGDTAHQNTDIEQGFSATPAARWLAIHAHRYGFELSFPPDNSQGVNHEPWHWRFIGNDDARAVFHPAPPKKL
ncbi:MAG: M15 family metallopeptidase [Elusimicrobia bacterium]|nr:M15 family metallopeptidase [Elusimicrobiota bacterium]